MSIFSYSTVVQKEVLYIISSKTRTSLVQKEVLYSTIQKTYTNVIQKEVLYQSPTVPSAPGTSKASLTQMVIEVLRDH